MRCSVICFTVRVLGTFTSIPDCSTGSVIIKITNSTSTTSTSGVMLISASDVRVCPFIVVNATLSALHSVGCPRSLAFGDLGNHEPHPFKIRGVPLLGCPILNANFAFRVGN